MPIIFSTTTLASPACQPPARIYFEAPDDALLARVTEKVAELMGRHLSYTFHDEAPGGVTPIILEDVGPSAPPVETTVVNYPHAAGVVPGSLLLKEYPSGRTLTDSGRGHLIDQDGRFAATVDYETGTIHQPQAIPDALAERGAKAWAGVDAQGLRDGAANAGSEPVAGLNEYGVRGYLAATLKCWHRLTGDEAAELVAMTQRLAGLYLHSSPPEGMVGGWMPMADAPRDGTLILAAIYIHSSDGTAEWQRHAIYFDEERDCTYFDGCDDTGWEFDDYEFWTPLPPPPTTSAGNEKGE